MVCVCFLIYWYSLVYVLLTAVNYAPLVLAVTPGRPSREAAEAYFGSLRNFASWDRESLKSWVQGAVVEDDKESNSPAVSLACHPHIEASIYTGRTLELNEQELAQPKCRAVFQSGARTQLFKHEFFAGLAEEFPRIYSVGAPMPKCSHLMVFEDPEVAAQRIVDALALFPPFSGADAKGSAKPPASRL